TILSQIGWRVSVIDRGYKHWRGLVNRQLYDTPFPAPIVLLGGGTGTGKTDILHHAHALGAQVIDLEGMAQHRGSVFGSTGGQPSQKLFETRLTQAIAALDPARPVLIEAESNRIGAIRLPPTLWDAMRNAELVEVSAPLDARANYIAHRYADLTRDDALLWKTLDGLRKHHSAAQVQEWRAMARQPAELARSLIALHYDPRYAKLSVRSAELDHLALPDLSQDRLKRAARTLCDSLSKPAMKS
ncbi:MAG: tRNA 2-selenouridine(34) synthase MnmH, partial [Alphaproteobacteria bacterium]|nr:tRNA 2-selenouridine(34) synthase MnmH [Alphaproteobacteria bacterium]